MDVSTNIEQPSSGSAEETITVIGFGRRLIAILIDGILLGFFSFLLAFAIGFVGIFIQMFNPYEPIPLAPLIIICSVILSVVYYVGFWSKSGQTLGNTLLGIKVVSKDGSGLSGGKAFLRYIGYIISGIVLSIGFIWVAFDRRRQGWHDKIAGTYVTYVEEDFSSADTVEFVPSDADRANWIWLVVWIIIALVIPGVLVGGLFVLGPVVAKLLTNLAP